MRIPQNPLPEADKSDKHQNFKKIHLDATAGKPRWRWSLHKSTEHLSYNIFTRPIAAELFYFKIYITLAVPLRGYDCYTSLHLCNVYSSIFLFDQTLLHTTPSQMRPIWPILGFLHNFIFV